MEPFLAGGVETGFLGSDLGSLSDGRKVNSDSSLLSKLESHPLRQPTIRPDPYPSSNAGEILTIRFGVIHICLLLPAPSRVRV
jgi:hypothetical protein